MIYDQNYNIIKYNVNNCYSYYINILLNLYCFFIQFKFNFNIRILMTLTSLRRMSFDIVDEQTFLINKLCHAKSRLPFDNVYYTIPTMSVRHVKHN